MTNVRRWLAVQATGDTVRLIPTEGHGPDFFVKANDYDELVRQWEDAKRAMTGEKSASGDEPKPNAGVKCSHCNGKGVPDQIYDERRGGWSAPDIPCETCYGKGRIYTVEQYLKTLPADWHEDSSLQTWFPLTSEEREANRLDANRYRWLKRYLCESGESFREVAFDIAHDKPKADWDAAIDAELASAQRTKPRQEQR